MDNDVLLGRGGQEHKKLQHTIKCIAQDKGYRATIEKQVLDGAGSIDVVVEKEGLRMACEVSITTTAEHELGNIQKCLKAGYDKVFLISPHMKTLNAVKELASASLPPDDLAKVQFYTPVDFEVYLKQLEADAYSAKLGVRIVRGYKVTTRFHALRPEEEEMKRQSILKTIFSSFKRTMASKDKKEEK